MPYDTKNRIQTDNSCHLPQLKEGDRGNAVETLQRLLVFYKYLTAKDVTGRFDRETACAVQKFQHGFHLLPDGIVGQKTWHALNYAFLSLEQHF
ncbi:MULTISPECIES: peptidoglycan-binding protein [Nostoc]|uniref:Peptidoglycan-binding protein n=1 Tax=Nostoc paludosum FACHB-159 TaxID=2692908 RepID=A0ABR8K9X6_9NOSO|nr:MULTISPECIES: peptidoglycan-binding domain-containing protein [Nostoc]MBD2679247.1 peptidoglycan-binding protein [Nostoc sp. FACHB-857]MBD2735629.1 peptidoglycan-binding protein [Nostoc paludosum FACHB-159]